MARDGQGETPPPAVRADVEIIVLFTVDPSNADTSSDARGFAFARACALVEA